MPKSFGLNMVDFIVILEIIVNTVINAYIKMTEKEAIQKFADAMVEKMLKRRERYKEFGWRDPEYKSITDLKIHLRQEIQEWEYAQEDLDELVDIANSCFMLWDRTKNDRSKNT